MYSNEERQRAIELLIQYDGQVTQTIRELGYPSRALLKRWKNEYLEHGPFTGERVHGKSEVYSAEQEQAAVTYYLEHGKSLSKAIRAMGYPHSTSLLSRWIDELAPHERRMYGSTVKKERRASVPGSAKHKHKHQQEKQDNPKVIQEFYDWRAYVAPRVKIVPRTYVLAGDDMKKPKTLEEADRILELQQKQIEEGQATLRGLEEQIRQQQLQLDIMQATYDLLKKGMGTDPKRLTNKEKTIVTNALRQEKNWPLGCLLSELDIVKSSYEY